MNLPFIFLNKFILALVDFFEDNYILIISKAMVFWGLFMNSFLRFIPIIFLSVNVMHGMDINFEEGEQTKRDSFGSQQPVEPLVSVDQWAASLLCGFGKNTIPSSFGMPLQPPVMVQPPLTSSSPFAVPRIPEHVKTLMRTQKSAMPSRKDMHDLPQAPESLYLSGQGGASSSSSSSTNLSLEEKERAALIFLASSEQERALALSAEPKKHRKKSKNSKESGVEASSSSSQSQSSVFSCKNSDATPLALQEGLKAYVKDKSAIWRFLTFKDDQKGLLVSFVNDMKGAGFCHPGCNSSIDEQTHKNFRFLIFDIVDILLSGLSCYGVKSVEDFKLGSFQEGYAPRDIIRCSWDSFDPQERVKELHDYVEKRTKRGILTADFQSKIDALVTEKKKAEADFFSKSGEPYTKR